jgi:hypothetical protein
LALRHPSISFIHIYPGVVKTPILNGLPFVLRAPMNLLHFLYTSQEDCGEAMSYGLTYEKYKKGHWLLNDKGDECQKNPKIHSEEARKIVWDHTVQLTQQAIKKMTV